MILSMLAGKTKLIGILSGIIGLGIALYQLHDHVYDAGRESMKQELISEQNKRYIELRKEYEKSVDNAVALIKKDYDERLGRIKATERIITQTKVVKEYVEKEIIVTEQCDVLATNIVSLLSQATSIVSNGPTANESSTSPN